MDYMFIRHTSYGWHNPQEMTNLYHFCVDLFNAIIDMQSQEWLFFPIGKTLAPFSRALLNKAHLRLKIIPS